MNTGQGSLDSCYITAQGAQSCVAVDETFKLFQVNHQLIDNKEGEKSCKTRITLPVICLERTLGRVKPKGVDQS